MRLGRKDKKRTERKGKFVHRFMCDCFLHPSNIYVCVRKMYLWLFPMLAFRSAHSIHTCVRDGHINENENISTHVRALASHTHTSEKEFLFS